MCVRRGPFHRPMNGARVAWMRVLRSTGRVRTDSPWAAAAHGRSPRFGPRGVPRLRGRRGLRGAARRLVGARQYGGERGRTGEVRPSERCRTTRCRAATGVARHNGEAPPPARAVVGRSVRPSSGRPDHGVRALVRRLAPGKDRGARGCRGGPSGQSRWWLSRRLFSVSCCWWVGLLRAVGCWLLVIERWLLIVAVCCLSPVSLRAGGRCLFSSLVPALRPGRRRSLLAVLCGGCRGACGVLCQSLREAPYEMRNGIRRCGLPVVWVADGVGYVWRALRMACVADRGCQSVGAGAQAQPVNQRTGRGARFW